MPKKKTATADELIWLFYEGLAEAGFRGVSIAIVPGAAGRWTALMSAAQRKRHPALAKNVARIEAQLKARYSLEES